MSRLLYIQASPRGQRSYSVRVADAFVDAYKKKNPNDEVETINIFEESLPTFDGFALVNDNQANRWGLLQETAGGYYAARMAILEELTKLRRQAGCLVFRFVTNEYYQISKKYHTSRI